MSKTKRVQRLISIIVPIYNAEKYITQCVKSILGQTYRHVEVILIDDGSTDSSLDICRGHASKDSRVKIIHQTNQGVSVARNKGVKASRGDFIMFVDADDYLDLSIIEKMVNELSAGVDIVMCNMTRLCMDGNLRPAPYGWAFDGALDSDKLVKELIKELRITVGGAVWGRLVNKENASQIKFDATMRVHEDQKWLLEVLQTCRKGIHMKEHLYFYRENDLSATKKYLRSDIKDKQKIDQLINDYAKNADADVKYFACNHSFIVGFEQYKCGILANIDKKELRLLRKELNRKYRNLGSNQKTLSNNIKYISANLPKRIFITMLGYNRKTKKGAR